MTQGEFVGIETDVGEGERQSSLARGRMERPASIAEMSDGTRDQLFLAFRLASVPALTEDSQGWANQS